MWAPWLTKGWMKKGLLLCIIACITFNMFLIFRIAFSVQRTGVTQASHSTTLSMRNVVENKSLTLTEKPKFTGVTQTSHSTTLSTRNVVENKSLTVTEKPKFSKMPTQSRDKQMSSMCPQMGIHPEAEVRNYAKNRACRPRLQTEESCEYTAELFAADASISICRDRRLGAPYTLCDVTEKYTKRNQHRKFDAKCDFTPCNRKYTIHLKIVNPSDGEMLILDIPGDTAEQKIAEYVEMGAEKTARNGFNFLFVECTGSKFATNISQMLTFLPKPSILQHKHYEKTASKKVNVNVVLLDSIARPHFYRSLPHTVKHLRAKQNDPSYKAHVFEFDLFQSVHGHTHENEHAFFSGDLYPDNFTKEQKEKSPTGFQLLFSEFKKSGYQTMGQNDMCWKSGYGHVDSFKTYDWVELRDAIKVEKSNIDTTGITDSFCFMLSKYGKTSPFHDSGEIGHQLCYNGLHQHKYLLNYVTSYLDTVRNLKHTKPLFAFTEINVSHDDVGVRVQTLDRDLTEFIDAMSEQPNTVTIIYADHGNTYTEYQYKMLEGRLEMYNPILLAILPKELGKKFGGKILKNLKTNQYRLLNLFDVRECVLALANYEHSTGSGGSKTALLKQVGFFGKIPANRTCHDLKLSTPNYCVCESSDLGAKVSTVHMALAEFAIGQLNNQIQSSLLDSRGSRTPGNQQPLIFGACARLRVERIMNVREHHTKGKLVTTIDIKVHSGNVVDQDEIFMVQVSEKKREKFVEMKLVTYNRISKYGVYRACADTGVPITLCICQKLHDPQMVGKNSIANHFSRKSKIREIKPCVNLIRRTYQEYPNTDHFVKVDAYELANTCNGYKFNITVDAEKENLISTRELPMELSLQPRTVYFVAVMKNEFGWRRGRLKWHFSIKKKTL